MKYLQWILLVIAFGSFIGSSLFAILGGFVMVVAPEKLDMQARAAWLTCLVVAMVCWARLISGAVR